MTTRLVAAGRTDVGRVREHNEDAFVIASIGDGRSRRVKHGRYDLDAVAVLLGVSDGMGGHAAGEVASALVVDVLLRALLAAGSPSLEALRSAVIHAHTDVRAAAEDDARRGMGATLAAALVVRRTAYITAVGDSRVYIVRGGDLVQLTHDQSVAQMLVDAGQLAPAAAASSPLKHVLAAAMGHGEDIAAELFSIALAPGDRLVLCSDGLTNEVEDGELVRVIGEEVRADAVCERLVATANQHGGRDNVTVVVADVIEEPDR
jgi:protein phosphatase